MDPNTMHSPAGKGTGTSDRLGFTSVFGEMSEMSLADIGRRLSDSPQELDREGGSDDDSVSRNTNSLADLQPSGSVAAYNSSGVYDARAAALRVTTRNSFSMQPKQIKRRKMTIQRGETEMSLFRHQQQREEAMFKVVIDGDDGGIAMRQVFERIDAALSLRDKYKGKPSEDAERAAILVDRLPRRPDVTCNHGIYHVSDHNPSLFCRTVSWRTFAADVEQLLLTVENSTCRKATSHRLDIIQERSKMFFLLNTDVEDRPSYRKGGGVYSSVTRVDNSIRMTRAINSQEMVGFFGEMFRKYPNEVIGRTPTGESLTLKELFRSNGVEDPSDLTTQGLGYHPPPHGKGRVDISEDAIGNPLTAALHVACIRQDGRFTAALYRSHMMRIDMNTENLVTEHRLSVYGTSRTEIHELARFLKKNEIGPYKRNRWFLHVRFCEHPPPSMCDCETLQDQFDNLFLPLFNATLAPDDPMNAAVQWLMPQIGGLHVETDVNRGTPNFTGSMPPPKQIKFTDPMPHDLYYLYYTWANLQVLNSVRRRKGLHSLQLRLNGSELGAMMGGYLLGDVVTRCTPMMNYPVMQYLYGVHHVAMCVSPLTDNARGIPYAKHPLPMFLHRCLNVTICTEAPMHTHHSSNPLQEEYATAQKLHRLSSSDVTELMRNSVMMSSFSHHQKCEWLGDSYHKVNGNIPEYSQVSTARIDFREEAWGMELEMMRELYRIKATGEEQRGSPKKQVISGVSRWHYLSSVKDVEYFNVLDNRIRFPRTVICGPHKEDEVMKKAAPLIAEAMALRHHYQWSPPAPWLDRRSEGNIEDDFTTQTDTFSEDEWTYSPMDAVYFPFPKSATQSWHKHIPTLEQFSKDLNRIKSICDNVDVKEFSFRRLDMLDHKFRLHLALNHANEAGTTENQATSNRDIYQATKVDTHVHMAAGMTARQMREFVLDKVKHNRADIAMKAKDGSILTLGSMMDKCGITQNLTVDQLSVQADHTLFERFDNFNNRYNPMTNPDLRTLLLKTDNFMNGRYFAELTHRVFDQFEKDRYSFSENRVSVYGINLFEWDKLSQWFDTHGMNSRHNKWMIQVPRVYKVFRGFNTIGSFGQYLQNIFKPLWDVSINPSKYPRVHNFLKHVSGFDSVDNEATLDSPLVTLSPWEWTQIDNPPYNYYMYHLYANVRTLNEFRAKRGFTTFDLRPHCGEAGSDEHLLGCFLCANAIGHGINLRNDPSMQYLYYLTNIGLHVSPLSNNALFLHFLKNPFPDFFRRGLNVSLSTDDPLMFHQTQEPLIEEYSIAARVWGFSPNDLCEIARNSTMQCGFANTFKRQRLGERYYMSSSLGNDPLKTHLSDIRVAFRFETYHTEISYLESVCGIDQVPRWMLTTKQETTISESQIQTEPEEVLLSTHDQAMEIALRDIEGRREQLKVLRLQVDSARRQQKGLVDQLTDIGIKRQEEARREEELLRKREPIRYMRENSNASRAIHMRSNSKYRASRASVMIHSRAGSAGEKPKAVADAMDAHRVLNWKPLDMSDNRRTKEVMVSRGQTRPMPAPPSLDASPTPTTSERRVYSAGGRSYSVPQPQHQK